jgi:hypothetical protein
MNIVVVKSSEVFEVYFPYAILKMDPFLLNSNKRCETQNKKGISLTSGKSVKKKIW